MHLFHDPIMLNLQLFAEGGTASGGETGVSAPAAGVQTGVDLSSVQYGTQESPAAEEKTPNLDQEFEEAIKGKYKAQYDKRMQSTIQSRLKGSKETVEKFNKLSPAIEVLAQKYGVDASDAEAVASAIMADDALIEDKAIEKGMSTESYREMMRMERENKEFHRMMQEQEQHQNAEAQYSRWLDQAEGAKAMYPDLDLNTEAQNPQFLQLLQSGIDVGTAYQVVHLNDILPTAMQAAAQTAERKVANRVIANGVRPSENGTQSRSTATIKSDVSQLSKADRDEIARRVARGERITF